VCPLPGEEECLTEALEPTARLALRIYDDRREWVLLPGEPPQGVWAGTTFEEREGRGLDDLGALLAFALVRAVTEGLAPPTCWRWREVARA
jgi:hypothetical protein